MALRPALDGFLRRSVLRDLYQPHTWYTFDGPYTRMQLADGSSMIIIMSSVWSAKKKPHLVHISYSPAPHIKEGDEKVPGFAYDFYPESMHADRRKQDDRDGVSAFTLETSIPEDRAVFQLQVDAGRQKYDHTFKHPMTQQHIRLEVDITKNTPHSLLGPMWIARFLPVPLKWHIFSTRSDVAIKISEGQTVLLEKKGYAHQEKNWGLGFPKAWIWIQAFCSMHDRGSLAVAGGIVTPFLTAFMLAFRSPTNPSRNWNFGPAWTMKLFGFSPFAKIVKNDSTKGEIELRFTNPLRGQRIVIAGQAPVDTFQVMAAPLPRGHTRMYCHESFQAVYKVTCFEKPWFRPWQKVEEVDLDNSALEFGGTWSHWWNQLSEKEKQE